VFVFLNLAPGDGLEPPTQ